MYVLFERDGYGDLFYEMCLKLLLIKILFFYNWYNWWKFIKIDEN